ncbi:MAG TPA: hypothetical protein DCQ52_14995, partial [Acidimicrobiaceae bacterium]|nr:hypothetical protein [Acidimicrobiaceae bacterium]
VITIVTGAGPQSNVITPPSATAATTACDVQLAGVPLPITRSGCEVSTGNASPGNCTPAGVAGVVVAGVVGGARRTAGWLAAAASPMRVEVTAIRAPAPMAGSAAPVGTARQPNRISVSTVVARTLTAAVSRTLHCRRARPVSATTR